MSAPHQINFGRDQFGIDTTFKVARRLVRLVVQTMRIPDQNPASAFAAPCCVRCGAPGIEGYCPSCQAQVTTEARDAFWHEENW